MIEVNGTASQELPKTLEEVYELLEPYHLRTVRLKSSARRYDEGWRGYRTINSRNLGRLIGLSVVTSAPDARAIRNTDSVLNFFIEGQPVQSLLFGEFTVEVFQEDAKKWIIVYDPKSEEDTR